MDRRKQIVIIFAAALAVLVALMLVFSGGGSDSIVSAKESREVQKRFQGIPQSDRTIGNPNAPETLIEFADLQCPYCGEFAKNALPEVIDKLVRPGKIKMQIHFVVVVGDGVQSQTAATAAAAAAEQNKAWQFLDLFYINQGVEETGYVTDQFISDIYKGSGVDAAKANEARASEAVAASLAEDDALASQDNITSTPFFVFVDRNGKRHKLSLSDLSYSSLLDAINKARRS